MSYRLTHDISCRLDKQLQIGPNHDVATLLDILKDLLRISQGKAIEPKRIVNLIIKLTQIKDLRIKKMVYLYLSFATDDDADMWLQVMNSVANDLSEPSPILKKSSLLLVTDSQSLSSTLNETRLSLLEKGLKDSNGGVRKCAAAGVAKFSKLIGNRQVELDMSATLKQVDEMIYIDDDPTVIIQCIRCLHSSKKYIENSLLISLLERLGMVNAWTKADIIDLFVQVVDLDKMSEDEIFHCLNIFDPYLDEKYALYLSLIGSSAMVFVSSKYSTIFKDVNFRVIDFMLSQLPLVSPSIQPAYLSMLEALTGQYPEKLQSHFKVFTPLFSDDHFVQAIKLKLLCKSCTQENSDYIFKVLTCSMLTSHKWELLEICAEGIFTLHQYLPDDCESFLVSMLWSQSEILLDVTVTVLWRLVLYGKLDLKLEENTLHSLVKCYAKLRSLEGKTAYFSLLGLFATEAQSSAIAAVLVTELEKWNTHDSIAYKLVLLRCIYVFYFLSPSHYCAVLDVFHSKASHDSNPLICRQAGVYHYLLKNDSCKLKGLLDKLIRLKCAADNLKNSITGNVEKIRGVCLLGSKIKLYA